jgi:1L-myo-inositol 1-phosphate cytidylyltransferase
MTKISEAVVLMAGSGSRLRVGGAKLPKPLTPVLGRPLISYTFEALAHAGITTAHAVVGYESDELIAKVRALVPRVLSVHFIENPAWEKQNGVSLLAAANHVGSPFLLTMSDHLFDASIVDLLLRGAVPEQLNLAIDRKLDSIFDLADAMKVQTRGDKIAALGKELDRYDAIDTGLFVCPSEIFAYLDNAKCDGDCSLADGVRAMARDGKARAIDIGDAWWQDVDTPAMLAAAEETLGRQIRRYSIAGSAARSPGKS